MYYIRECGYGRSKRTGNKMIPIMVSVLILALGMGSVTVQVLAGDKKTFAQIAELEPEHQENLQEPAAESVEEVPTETISPKIEDDVDYVVIDPGHGGEDEGCSRDIVLEKDINLQIALLLKVKLQQMGYEVLLTREGDESVELEERVRSANAAGGDIYISIHQNACEESESEINGIETFYCGKQYDQNSRRLAQLIQNNVIL